MMNQYEISVSDLKSRLEKADDFLLLDVRSLEEHRAFNIGGLLIPLNELSVRVNELDSTKEIIAYCRSGGRSLMAVELLRGAGLKRVKSLQGGMLAWQAV